MSATFADSIDTLHRIAQETIDRIERKYDGRTRIEMVRRQCERESNAEIRAALRGCDRIDSAATD